MYPSSISYFYFSVATQKTYVVNKDYYRVSKHSASKFVSDAKLFPVFLCQRNIFFQPNSIFENFDTA